MTRFFNIDFQKRWGTFSIYEKFEHLNIRGRHRGSASYLTTIVW
jgi:hypothetical protein